MRNYNLKYTGKDALEYRKICQDFHYNSSLSPSLTIDTVGVAHNKLMDAYLSLFPPVTAENYYKQIEVVFGFLSYELQKHYSISDTNMFAGLSFINQNYAYASNDFYTTFKEAEFNS